MSPSSSPRSSPTSSGDECDKMGRHNSNARGFPSSRRPELDLSAMLSMEQKNQLHVLMIAIMDNMQQNLRETFDNISVGRTQPDQGIDPLAPITTIIPNARSDKYRHLYGNVGLDEKPNFESREALLAIMKPVNLPARGPRTPKPALTIPKSPDEASVISKKTEKEILTSNLSELKRDVLGHFGKWRLNVLRRVGDIVIKNGGHGGNVVGQVPQHVPGGPAAGQGPQQALGNARRGGAAARRRPPRPSATGPNQSDGESSIALARIHPALYTPLVNCPKEKRAMILHAVLLLLLGLDQYNPYSRILLMKLTSSLHIPTFVLAQDEDRICQALAEIVKGISPEEIAQKRAEEGKPPKRWRGGSAMNSAAAGVLAAPLVSAGIGTVFGGVGLGTSATASLLGAMGMAESTVIVGTLFGLYGARQGGKTMEAYAKDIQDFALIPTHGSLQAEFIDPKDVPAENRRMRVTMSIGGWITADIDSVTPSRVLGKQSEVYALRWEVEALAKLGDALETVVKSAAWTEAKKEVVGRSVFDSLRQSHWPVGLLRVSKIVDNPWTVGMVRAEKAGLVLADMIINKMQGERPVTLIGFSLGARIIYSCLMALSEKRAFGLVENVVLMGAPCPSETRVWAAMKSVVAGRLVNVFSTNDYLLGFLYRTCTWPYGVAGLQSIDGVPKVENFDATELVSNHVRYQYMAGCVLKKLGWEDINYAQVTADNRKLAALMKQEQELDKQRKGGLSEERNQNTEHTHHSNGNAKDGAKGKGNLAAIEKQMRGMKLDGRENRRPG